MAKYLVIVESPAKSKTIEKYLGPDYVVASSLGHVRDLTTRGYGGFGVDIENDFCPMYKVMSDKKALVRELKRQAKQVEKVYLATDPDREGEAISYHLLQVLELKNIPYERIVFNEITKTAVLNAIDNGRQIDMNLVYSQESRRIIDRILGFSMSKLLQKKIGSKSAGRVQSVALQLICEREKEIEAFDSVEYWEIFLEFSKGAKKLKAKLETYKGSKVELHSKAEAEELLLKLADEFSVLSITKKTRTRKAPLPYTTSTLQQDCSSKFNFNSKKTMMLAQKLYEGVELGSERVGLITYMRTDSIRLSSEFVAQAKGYIAKMYGENYYLGYNSSNHGAFVQDAHEAIRVTSAYRTPESIKAYLTNDEYKLYSIIYSRSLSCMMANALLEDTKVEIKNGDFIFGVSGEKVLFDGFLKLHQAVDEESTKALPEFKDGETLKGVNVLPEQKFTNPPARYTEAKLIKKMEELGIGRPSTYAVTMETLKARGYAKVEKKTFIPTKQGMLTNEMLSKYFASIINVTYTSNMEHILDEIALANASEKEELKKFYNDYKPLLDNADASMERMYPIELDETCPECGSKLLIRNGRFGEFIACSGFPKCHYIRSIQEKEQPVSTGITCPVCGKGVIVERVSKRGKSKGQKFYACNRYPSCSSTWTSLDEIKIKGENN